MTTFKLPKLVLTDIDGVWTDGGMYYFNNKEEGKKFNVRDGVGTLLLKSAGIPWGIITGEKSELLENRAQKLKCEILLMNVKNKTKASQGTSRPSQVDRRHRTKCICSTGPSSSSRTPTSALN